MKKKARARKKRLGTAALAVGLVALVVVVFVAVNGIYGGQSNLAAVGAAPIQGEEGGLLGFLQNLFGLNSKPTFSVPVASVNSASGVTGRYDVGVPKNISLATASSTITAMGVKVLFGFQYLHALVIDNPTTAQLTALQKNPDVSWIEAEVAAIPAACALSSTPPNSNNNGTQPVTSTQGGGYTITNGGTPGSSGASVRVAIVDSGDHGNAVLATYNAACAGTCADTSPILMDDADPTGQTTDASVADAIIGAISQGAHVINLSAELGNVPASAGNDPYFNTTDNGNGIPLQNPASGTYNPAVLNALSFAASQGVIIVAAAGNNPNYENAAGTPSGTGATVVTVGALDAPNSGIPDENGGTSDETPTIASYSSPGQIYADGDAVGDADGVGAIGTSFAAPRATVAIADSLAQTGTNDPSQAVANLENGNSCSQINSGNTAGKAGGGTGGSESVTIPLSSIPTNTSWYVPYATTPNVIVCDGDGTNCINSDGTPAPNQPDTTAQAPNNPNDSSIGGDDGSDDGGDGSSASADDGSDGGDSSGDSGGDSGGDGGSDGGYGGIIDSF